MQKSHTDCNSAAVYSTIGQYSTNPVGRLLPTHLLRKWRRVTDLELVGGQGEDDKVRACGGPVSEDDKKTICELKQGVFSDNYNETNSDTA